MYINTAIVCKKCATIESFETHLKTTTMKLRYNELLICLVCTC